MESASYRTKLSIFLSLYHFNTKTSTHFLIILYEIRKSTVKQFNFTVLLSENYRLKLLSAEGCIKGLRQQSKIRHYRVGFLFVIILFVGNKIIVL